MQTYDATVVLRDGSTNAVLASADTKTSPVGVDVTGSGAKRTWKITGLAALTGGTDETTAAGPAAAADGGDVDGAEGVGGGSAAAVEGADAADAAGAAGAGPGSASLTSATGATLSCCAKRCWCST